MDVEAPRPFVVVKAELQQAMQEFVDAFNQENGAQLTLEELRRMESQHDVNHVLWILTTYGAEYPDHMQDKLGDLSRQLPLGGWTHQRDMKE